MHKPVSDLDTYFEILRNEPTISPDRVRSIVEKGTAIAGTELPRNRTRGIIMTSTAIIGIVVPLLLLLNGAGEGDISTSPARPVTRAITYSAPESNLPKANLNHAQPRGEVTISNRVLTVRSIDRAKRTTGSTGFILTEGENIPNDTLSEAKPTLVSPMAPSVAATRVVELSSQELASLGVNILPDGTMEGYARSIHVVHQTRGGVQSDSVFALTIRYRFDDKGIVRVFEIPETEVPAGITPSIEPEMITDATGQRRYRDIYGADRPDNEKITRLVDSLQQIEFTQQLLPVKDLIPVAIKTADQGDLIFWYTPAPSFLNGLPPCLGEELAAECAAQRARLTRKALEWRERNSRKLSPDLMRKFDSLQQIARPVQPCTDGRQRGVAGQPWLDTWRSSGGAISSTEVTPNPAHGACRVEFTISSSRMVGVNLHDINGRLVRVLLPQIERGVGRHSIELSLEKIPAGFYLIAVSTDRGEQGVQRIVVQ